MQSQIVYTYRYFWKDKQDKLYVRFLTESLEGHKQFIETLNNDLNIKSCMREYVGEVNFAYLGFTETVKQEIKEENNYETESN